MEPRPRTILIAHHDARFEGRVREALGSDDAFQLTHCASATAAIEQLNLYTPELIILDLDLPGPPLQVLCHVAETTRLGEHLPVVGVVTLADPDITLSALELGAVDVLTYPLNLYEFRWRILNHLHLAATITALARVNRALSRQIRQIRQQNATSNGSS